MRLNLSKRMRAYFARKAQNLEDNGNPAAAQAYRERWGVRPTDTPKPKKQSARPARVLHEPDDAAPKREPMTPRSRQ